MELSKQLVSSLGVSEGQAKGGAGMLFKLAQDKLSADELAQIDDKVSGLDDIASAAPDFVGDGLTGAVAGWPMRLTANGRVVERVSPALGMRRRRQDCLESQSSIC